MCSSPLAIVIFEQVARWGQIPKTHFYYSTSTNLIRTAGYCGKVLKAFCCYNFPKLKEKNLLKTGSDKIIVWLGRYFFLPKRLVILYSNQKFSSQPLTFFDAIKPRRREYLPSHELFYQTPSLVVCTRIWLTCFKQRKQRQSPPLSYIFISLIRVDPSN